MAMNMLSKLAVSAQPTEHAVSGPTWVHCHRTTPRRGTADTNTAQALQKSSTHAHPDPAATRIEYCHA